jgi:HSP20 family protein
MRHLQTLLHSEVGELADEVRRLFADLDRTTPAGPGGTAGGYTPSLDVLETDQTIVLLLDVPGVPPTALRVLLKADVVLIAGDKTPPANDAASRDASSYHLVEREFGRFARAIRVTRAFDGGRAHATVRGGELRIVLPKITDRRGKEIQVEIA